MTLYERSVQARIYDGAAHFYSTLAASSSTPVIVKHWRDCAAEAMAKARAVRPEDERRHKGEIAE